MLVAPVARAAVGDGGVFLIGDSVMAGAEDALQTSLLGRELTLSTWVGRHLSQGVDELQRRRGEIGDTAVVHLGNNWYGTPASLDADLDRARIALRGVSRVVWVNTHNKTDWMTTVNAGIARAQQRWPELLVLDWYTAVRRDPGLVYSDDTHLTPRGRTVYARMVADAVNVPGQHHFVACRPSAVPSARPDHAAGHGYWMVTHAGRVISYGVPHLGDVAGRGAQRLVATDSGGGYWIVDGSGTIHAFGDAAGARPPAEVVVPARGLPFPGIVPFGHAQITGVASAPHGGFWLAATDGGVFSVGAPFHGSATALVASTVIEDVEAAPGGYWLLAGDGGVFSFGADYHGSLPALGLCGDRGAVALRSTRSGKGYWIVTDAGHVYTFGDAPYLGGGPSLGRFEVVIDLDGV